MKVDTGTISTFETSLLLRLGLGDLRGNWGNCLADMLRGKTSIKGITLLPCARKHDGKMYRPVYAITDIQEFIEKVKSKIPSAGKTPVKSTVLQIDTGKGWRLNKFDRHGAPVARYRSASQLYQTGTAVPSMFQL